jgi:hypothetical protein
MTPSRRWRMGAPPAFRASACTRRIPATESTMPSASPLPEAEWQDLLWPLELIPERFDHDGRAYGNTGTSRVLPPPFTEGEKHADATLIIRVLGMSRRRCIL